MVILRRDVLHLLACATGSALTGHNSVAAQEAPKAQSSPVIPPTDSHQDVQREKVVGIGGFFFKAQDPAASARWYQEHLGISLTPTNYGEPVWRTEEGPTVFTPFPLKSHYFGDAKQMWMVNFRVRNLDRIVAQLKSAGITVDVDPQQYPNGHFARLQDPDGNPIELWQPVAPVATP